MAQRIGRRRFLLGGAAAVVTSGLGYGCGAEPRRLERVDVPLRLDRPWTGRVRILHLSDFHLSRFVGLSFIASAVRMGLEASPDLICLTGDFVTAADPTSLEGYAEVLRLLPAAAPTFAVFGNHDGGPWCASKGGETTTERVRGLLEVAGIDVLHNRAASVPVPNGRIQLVGVGDLWGEECTPAKACREREPEVPTLLLAHNPDTKDLASPWPWDLMLSGHTHGGQVVLPWIGPPFVPVEDRRFTAGLHPWEGRWIYTTRGVGSILGIRIHCRPEVTLLTVSGEMDSV